MKRAESDRVRKSLAVAFLATAVAWASAHAADIGREVAVERHLQDGEEFDLPVDELLEHGQRLFEAVWTDQEGGGRPMSKGVGKPLSDPADPLLFPRNFNRLSAPDANSCAGCHNLPRAGGGGDVVANVFVLAQRFDFATFDAADPIPTKGAVDERGQTVRIETLANSRNTLGMFGSGFIEMLARQMTADLVSLRDALGPGGSVILETKGIAFGTLARDADGAWVVDGVSGLAAPSLATDGPDDPPSLVVRPFHQAGAVISLREFTNNAFNHHHGIQSAERFGPGLDPDGDGFTDEMTRADVTASSLWQAQLAVPGRMIPDDPQVEDAVLRGEEVFAEIGCADCHLPSLPLDDGGWIFTEPNPFNPAGNLQPGEVDPLAIDLTSSELDLPRLSAHDGVVQVPAYTDLKLHDITSGPDDPNREPLNMHHPAGSEEFFAGNSRFLTRKLWGVASEPPYFHHGQYTTLRQAIEAHHGEAEFSHQAWTALPGEDRDSVIEFLKTLRILPDGTQELVVNETGEPKAWPPSGEGDDDDEDSDDDWPGRRHHAPWRR